jgi:hypothetical protein
MYPVWASGIARTAASYSVRALADRVRIPLPLRRTDTPDIATTPAPPDRRRLRQRFTRLTDLFAQEQYATKMHTRHNRVRIERQARRY